MEENILSLISCAREELEKVRTELINTEAALQMLYRAEPLPNDTADVIVADYRCTLEIIIKHLKESYNNIESIESFMSEIK